MSEPVSFSEQLRAWRQRKEARAAAPAATGVVRQLLPFRRCFDPRLEDRAQGRRLPGSTGCAPSRGCRWSRISRSELDLLLVLRAPSLPLLWAN